MLYGILVFGNLLSELAELNHAARSEELTKMESVQAAVDFMAGHDVPFSLNNEVLRWTRFHHAHSISNVNKKDFDIDLVLMRSGRPLARSLARAALSRCTTTAKSAE